MTGTTSERNSRSSDDSATLSPWVDDLRVKRLKNLETVDGGGGSTLGSSGAKKSGPFDVEAETAGATATGDSVGV